MIVVSKKSILLFSNFVNPYLFCCVLSTLVWQAASNNYNQYLQIDLSERKLITSVATQGYRGSGQFVVDYHIEYSNDANTFTPIVNDLGESRVCRQLIHYFSL